MAADNITRHGEDEAMHKHSRNCWEDPGADNGSPFLICDKTEPPAAASPEAPRIETTRFQKEECENCHEVAYKGVSCTGCGHTNGKPLPRPEVPAPPPHVHEWVLNVRANHTDYPEEGSVLLESE